MRVPRAACRRRSFDRGLVVEMSDIFSKAKRSEVMSKVKSIDTEPEMIVRKYLFARGFRYRKHVKILPGKPDIVLPKYKTVIFVHGCFWHGHDCKYGTLPQSGKAFWQKKISQNRERDKKQTEHLRQMGWRVLTVWQCELKNKACAEETCEKIVRMLEENMSK